MVPETWGRSAACSLGHPPLPSAAHILPVFVSGLLWTFRSSNLCHGEELQGRGKLTLTDQASFCICSFGLPNSRPSRHYHAPFTNESKVGSEAHPARKQRNKNQTPLQVPGGGTGNGGGQQPPCQIVNVMVPFARPSLALCQAAAGHFTGFVSGSWSCRGSLITRATKC